MYIDQHKSCVTAVEYIMISDDTRVIKIQSSIF